jgi:hypothetical protein
MTTHHSASDRIKTEVATTPTIAGQSSKSANDSHGQQIKRAPRRYFTKAEVIAIEARLNDRQRSCLIDIDRLGTATGRQLERLHYESTDAGRRLCRLELARLVELGVLQRLTRQIGGVRSGSRGYVYALGLTGQRIRHPNKLRYRPPWTPQPSYLRHALNVSDLYFQLKEAERTGHLELATYDAEPRCWRSFAGPGGQMITLKPDAFASIYQGDFEDRLFIEMDLGTEDGNRILAKCKTFLSYWRSGKEQEHTGVFPLVCWVATTEARRDFLLRTIERLKEPEQAIFTVTIRDEFVNHIAASPIEDGEQPPPKEVNS